MVPLATGMALTATLLALRGMRPPTARYVLWPRIDQKTCLKAVQASGYEPVVVPMRLEGDELVTDVEVGAGWLPGSRSVRAMHAQQSQALGRKNSKPYAWLSIDSWLTLPGCLTPSVNCLTGFLQALQQQVARLGAEAIACILTTTSCFAPRAADDVVAGACCLLDPQALFVAALSCRAGKRGATA